MFKVINVETLQNQARITLRETSGRDVTKDTRDMLREFFTVLRVERSPKPNKLVVLVTGFGDDLRGAAHGLADYMNTFGAE